MERRRRLMVQGGALVLFGLVLVAWWGIADRGRDGGEAVWMLGTDELPASTRVVPLFVRDPGGGCGSYVTGRLKTPQVSYRDDEIEIELRLDRLPAGDYTCEGFSAELVMVDLREPLGDRMIVGADPDEVIPVATGPPLGLSGVIVDDVGDQRFWYLDTRDCALVVNGPEACIDDRGQADGALRTAAAIGDGAVVVMGLMQREITDVALRVPGGPQWLAPAAAIGGDQWAFAWAIDDSTGEMDRLEVFARRDGAAIASEVVAFG